MGATKVTGRSEALDDRAKPRGWGRRHALAALLAASLHAACGGEGTGPSTGGGGASSSSTGGGGAMSFALTWSSLSTFGAPTARTMHSAVWTGSKMIVWGGATAEKPSVTATGGVFDPATGAWTPTSTQGAPSPRSGHVAVWTGSTMIVWGGYGESDYVADGAAYDPASDTWAPIATAGQPTARLYETAVWTGNSMVIWGGTAGQQVLGDGALYDPASDAWTTMSGDGALSQRFSHTAVWTGTELLFWGGYDFFDWLGDGAAFDPSVAPGGAWRGDTEAAGAPRFRDVHAGVWAASRMIVWGGWTGGPYEDTGGIFDPAAPTEGAWTTTSKSGVPEARGEHAGVGIGSALVVWGGCGRDQCAHHFADGGLLVPDDAGGAWTPIPEQSTLSARKGVTAVFTGTSVLFWGGRGEDKAPLGDGAELSL